MFGSPEPGLRKREVALLLLLGLWMVPEGVAGQGVEAVIDGCVSGMEELRPSCRDAVLAGQAVRGGVGLLSGHGTPVPGLGSTLGRRLETTPRIALSLRATGSRLRVPDFREDPGALQERSFIAPSTQLSVGVGVVDGFTLAPTVGGVLSVDVLGMGSVVHLPGDAFGGNALTYGAGVRVGLLRESFTLPGVSVSAVRHGGPSIRHGDLFSDEREVQVKPTTTSLRATLGKDFFAFGLVAGAGLDRYGGRIETRILHSDDGGLREIRHSDAPTDQRAFAFAGGTLTFLVLQLAGELGWAPGVGDETPTGAGFDPSRGAAFGSIGVRLTY